MASARKVIVKSESCVSCPTCSYEIPLFNTKNLPREFSVLCPSCGGRKLYEPVQIHSLKQEFETTQVTARQQFGMRQAIGDDETAGPMPAKSRLGEITAWFLQ